MDCMALSKAAKKWLKQHGLEGFLRIVEAPAHIEAEKVVKDIDTEVITEEAIRALTGLPEGGIFTIDNPTPCWDFRSFRMGCPEAGEEDPV